MDVFIDTAAAVMKIKAAIAVHLATFNFVGAALAASQIPFIIGSGIIQAAVISSQKYALGGLIEEFAKGGIVTGPVAGLVGEWKISCTRRREVCSRG